MSLAPSVVKDSIPPRLFLYDGVCGMCNQFVQTMLKIDRDGCFSFAPLQGETAAALRASTHEVPDGLNTIVYIEAGRVYLFSDAILRAAAHLPAPWSWSKIFWIIPRFLRDIVYRFIARNRYKVWGKYDSCRIPTTDLTERLLP